VLALRVGVGGVAAAELFGQVLGEVADAPAGVFGPGEHALGVELGAAEVDHAVADLGDQADAIAQALLTALEVQAVQTARPAQGSADLIVTATRTGRTVTVVTNNSTAAVTAYLTRQHLDPYVGKIIGRDDPDPARMTPSPYRVRIAVGDLKAEPEECVFIGDTTTDVLAGLLGGVAVIGYANKPGKTEALSHAGARAVVTDLAEITTALRDAPSNAPSNALPN
jgi:beta-phosphoglucomutase-like phosphatase (HAD superfamily)